MARLARVVVPGVPHHVTQRGNRRERVFFDDDDCRAYLELISAAAKRSGTAIWSYCLMPNHVHFLMVPSEPDGLRKTFAEAHRRYTGRINARFKWTGHLWQGRFSSTPMDGRHTIAAIRYVAMNPVRAKLAERAGDWPCSSVRAHLAGADDGVVETRPVLDLVGDFAMLLDEPEDAGAVAALRRSRTTGRPAGSEGFMTALEDRLGRILAPAKRGPKPRGAGAAAQADLFLKVSP